MTKPRPTPQVSQPAANGPLYVLGGRQKKLLFKSEDEPHLYEAALILQIDTETGASKVCVEYKSPPAVCPGKDSSHVFKCGTLVGNLLYACTSTEVMVFEVPSFERTCYVSIACFNDLHHVAPSHDGHMLVANTGLDMVVKVTAKGRSLEYWNVLGEGPWSRFSPEVNYRKRASTKPHRSHPNYVFELGDEVWVTRFTQRDAVCLTQPGKKIRIGVETPHDGIVMGNRIYFTTVDGKVVIAGRESLKVEETVDLNKLHGKDHALLGWCRGLLPVDGDKVWVGFTRVRKTALKENILWVKHAFRETEAPTHLALYDLAAKRCLKEIDLEQYGMNVVFGMHPAPIGA